MEKLTRNVIAILISQVLIIGIGCVYPDPKRSSTEFANTTVIVVRHAEAYKNLPQTRAIPKEKLDTLTPVGIQQAKKAGASLKNKKIAAIIASPTGRTGETAQIIAEEVGLKGAFSGDPAFLSMKEGITPDGKPVTWSWREAQWGEGRDPRPDGGESLEDATVRAIQGVKTLVRKYPGKTVVIVTHSDICAGLVGHAENTPFPQRYAKHEVGLGVTVEIVIDSNDTWRLR